MQRYLMTSVACAALSGLMAPNTDTGSSPAAFTDPTWLYSEAVPAGQLFQPGDAHPGPGWFDHPSLKEQPKGDAPAPTTPFQVEALIADAVTAAKADQAAQFDVAYGERGKLLEAVEAERDELRRQLTEAHGQTEEARSHIAELEVKAAADAARIAELEAQVAEKTIKAK